MAKFGGMTLTKEGRNLLAKALTGKDLKFVRVATGDGRLPAGQNIYDMTAMVHPLQDLPIASCTVTGVGTATIQAVMTNQGLDMGFFVREIGLFAKDPDSGAETLYGYCNAGDEADYMPGQNGPDVVQYLLALVAVIDQAQNVTAVISEGLVFVTPPELEQRLKDIFPPATGGVDPADIAAIWARLNSDQGNILRPIDITLIKQMVLGSDMHDVNHMLRSITGQLIWNDLHNRYSRDKVHIELFYKDGITMSSHLKIPVEEVVVGSDCIDVTDTRELEVGLEYLLSDANGQEFVKVKEVLTKERFRTEEPVKRAYDPTSTVICLSNWTYDDDRDGGAVAQAGQVYQSKTLDMVCNAKGEHSIIIRRDLGEGTLTVERWTGEAWVACEVSENVLSSGGYGTPPEDQRMLAIYNLPYVLQAPTKIRVTCTKGPVKVDWIVVKSLFCAAEAPKPRISKTRSWDTPGTYQWTAPAGTTFVKLTAIAGGGGGGSSMAGVAGEGVVGKAINVVAGRTYTITVGLGGKGIQVANTGGTIGGNTSFDTLLTLKSTGVQPPPIFPREFLFPHDGIGEGRYIYGGPGASGLIPGSRGGLAAMRVPGDANSLADATDGVRGGGGGSGVDKQYVSGIQPNMVLAKAGGNGGNGYLELSWEEDGSWN